MFKYGTKVMLKEDVLQNYPLRMQEKLEQRKGYVEFVWGKHVLVFWLKRGNRGKVFLGSHTVNELRQIDIPQPPA